MATNGQRPVNVDGSPVDPSLLADEMNMARVCLRAAVRSLRIAQAKAGWATPVKPGETPFLHFIADGLERHETDLHGHENALLLEGDMLRRGESPTVKAGHERHAKRAEP